MTIKKNTQKRWLNKIIFISLLFIFFMFLSQSLFAKSLSIKTDRDEIEMGDIINLVIQTDFQTFDSPDLSVLEDQFEIIGQQRSSQISMVNGNFQAFSRWDISLTPKQAGDLIIPPLTVSGISSEPYPIKVVQFNANKLDKGPSFLESSVNINQAYVQQEVIFTLRFYYQGQLIDGNIQPPNFSNAIFKKLRNQVNYRKQMGGRVYEVFEWSWAFYPQKSGDLTIPEQRFDGRVQYNSHIKLIKEQSQALTIHVLPQVDSYPKHKTWLPAKGLLLNEKWLTDSKIHIGDSIARQIDISAKGLMASQLPELKFEDNKNYHIYPGKTEKQNHKTDTGILSGKTLEIAIVPTQAGEITLPEIKIPWWNTKTQKMETSVLPAKTLTVLPALHQQVVPQKNTAIPMVSHETTVDNGIWSNTVWPVLTLITSGFWMITLWIMWQQRQQLSKLKLQSSQQTNKIPSMVSVPQELNNICEINDAKDFYQAINRWMLIHNPPVSNSLENSLQSLKSHLYHGTGLPENLLTKICSELKHLFQQPTDKSIKNGRQLDKLYPK